MARRSGAQLTATETLMVQGMAGGSYFVENEVPSGDINGSNTSFTLAHTPNPASSLELKLNGSYIKAGGVDFTLTGDDIEMVLPPEENSILLASYRVSP